MSAFNRRKKYSSTAEEFEKFRFCSEIIPENNRSLSIAKYPSAEEKVFLETGDPILLTELIGEGGEGNIYGTNSPFLAKIYKEGKSRKMTEEKLSLMLSRRIICNGICYPTAKLFDKNGTFVGFLMPAGRGKDLDKLWNDGTRALYFPDWERKDLIMLCVTLLEKIKYLHDRNLLIGDINGKNFLVETPEKVWFVDTDSYQVEGYPCPVGTEDFSAPEIQNRNFRTFLRTKGNENFAVAVLLFKVMMLGKHPYSQIGGESIKDNIKEGNFPYLKEEHSLIAPKGPWEKIWESLPSNLRDAFFNTFSSNGKYNMEEMRPGVDEWLDLFLKYQKKYTAKHRKNYTF